MSQPDQGVILKAAFRNGQKKLDTVRLMVLGRPTRGKSSTETGIRRQTSGTNHS